MISAVIITYNEEDHIQKCITSLKGIADEVILVDASSTDRTIDIAIETLPSIKTYVKSWEGYGAARNFGASKANHDWIFSMDADERCSFDLRDQVSRLSLDTEHFYSFLRVNYYAGRSMKNGMLRPEWKPRLYHKSRMTWDNRLVHEQLTGSASSEVPKMKKLDGHLHHYPYSNHEDHVARLKNYAQLSAASWIEDGIKPNPFQKLLGPMYHYCRNHFFRLGILEGRSGRETSKAAYLYSKYKYQAYDELAKS